MRVEVGDLIVGRERVLCGAVADQLRAANLERIEDVERVRDAAVQLLRLANDARIRIVVDVAVEWPDVAGAAGVTQPTNLVPLIEELLAGAVARLGARDRDGATGRERGEIA